MKHYYALYNFYGCNTCGNVKKYYLAFESAAARDEYVAAHEWQNGKITHRACSRREVAAALGGNFCIVYHYADTGIKKCENIGRCHPCINGKILD